MSNYNELKSIWKKLRIHGQIKNFSSHILWALETDTGQAVAHQLQPMSKSPPETDVDAFKRMDGKSIENHSSWWKFYDFSTVDIFDPETGDELLVSVITKTPVTDEYFGKERKITYSTLIRWGQPLRLITGVARDKRKNIIGYFVDDLGLIGKQQALVMTCHGQIDNARPVFPASGLPYIRTRRDKELMNNISNSG